MNEYEFQRRWDALQDAYDNQDDDYDDDDEEKSEEDECFYEPDYEAILENRREWASYERRYGGW